MIAHGVSRGMGFTNGEEPRMGRKKLGGFCRPVRGLLRSTRGPTADAVGYVLSALRALGGRRIRKESPAEARRGLGARGLRSYSYSYSYSGRWEQGEVMRGGCGSSTSTALRAEYEYEYEYERRGGRGHWGQICPFDRSRTGQGSEWICCPTCPRPMVLGRGRYRRRGDVPVFFYRCGSNLVLAIRGSGPQAWEMLLMDPPSCGGTRVGAGSRPAAPA